MFWDTLLALSQTKYLQYMPQLDSWLFIVCKLIATYM